jgi:hypothetical protein
MNRLEKLKWSKSFSKEHKAMFEFCEWLLYNNESGDDMLADYMPFISWCTDELNKQGFKLDSIPRSTNKDNWVTRYMNIRGKIRYTEYLKQMDYNHDLRMFSYNGIVKVDLVEKDCSSIGDEC